MRTITIVLAEQPGGRQSITVIRNETPPRVAVEACQLAAGKLLEEAIRAEMASSDGDEREDESEGEGE